MSKISSEKPLIVEQEDGDIELVDKNILGAMVVDNIAESFPGIKHFFNTLKLVDLNDTEAKFFVSDMMTAEWINNHYLHILQKVFDEEAKDDVGSKRVVVESKDRNVSSVPEIKIKKEPVYI